MFGKEIVYNNNSKRLNIDLLWAGLFFLSEIDICQWLKGSIWIPPKKKNDDNKLAKKITKCLHLSSLKKLQKQTNDAWMLG